MRAAREYELKFDVGPHDLNQLLDVIGPATATRRLVSTYFDTDDGALREQKVSLRVRRSPDGLIHTLKRTGASIVDREEWEHESSSATPDLAWLRGTSLRHLFPASIDLKPQFTVDVHRSLFAMTYDGATIEGALDRGTISAGAASLVIAEFEMELKTGRSACVLALARQLADDVPMVIDLASKAARGTALTAGRWGRPMKDLDLHLRGDMPLADAFPAVVHACLALFQGNAALLMRQDDTPDPDHVEAVHKARVALRRLRAALQMFSPVLRRRWRASLRTDVKWMSDKFGTARDADVFLTEVIAAIAAEREGGGQALIDMMIARRDRARRALRRALLSPRWRRACLDLVEASESGVRRRVRDRRLAGLLRRQFRKRHEALARDSRGLKHLSVDAKHDVRKRAKMLRYGLDFIAGQPETITREPAGFERLRDDLQGLQQKLGVIHDGDALRDYLRREIVPDVGSARGAAEVAARIAAQDPDTAKPLRKAVKAARRIRRAEVF